MKRNLALALAGAISLAGIGAAAAADLPVKARPLPVPVYSWTGCYIGLSAGGKGVRTDDTVFVTTVTGAPLSSQDFGRLEAETWIAGGQVGCNYQSGRWVFGIEGDAHAQSWTTSSIVVGQPPFPFAVGGHFELHSDWQASARGRIGYALDRTLFYVTGGAAFTEVRAFSNWAAFGGFPGLVLRDTKTLVGGTVGAGVEHAVTDNFTLGLEGRYSWYGRERVNTGVVSGVIGGEVPLVFNFPTYRDVRLETGEVLFKANWKFGPTAVVARY